MAGVLNLLLIVIVMLCIYVCMSFSVQYLIESYPEGTAVADNEGLLPLHYSGLFEAYCPYL
jgi:hypothetical protein